MLAQLDGHLNNIAAAATNKKAVLKKLVRSNETLTNTNGLLVAENKRFQAKVSSCHPTNSSSDTATIKLLRVAIKYKWVPGGFCSTHGWGNSEGHTSRDCKNKGAGHVDTATCENPVGPGTTKNKEWDDGLL